MMRSNSKQPFWLTGDMTAPAGECASAYMDEKRGCASALSFMGMGAGARVLGTGLAGVGMGVGVWGAGAGAVALSAMAAGALHQGAARSLFVSWRSRGLRGVGVCTVTVVLCLGLSSVRCWEYNSAAMMEVLGPVDRHRRGRGNAWTLAAPSHGRQQGRGTLSLLSCSLYQYTVHSIPAAADSLSLRCAGGADTLPLPWAGTGSGEVRLSPAGDAPAVRARASYGAVEGHAACSHTERLDVTSACFRWGALNFLRRPSQTQRTV